MDAPIGMSFDEAVTRVHAARYGGLSEGDGDRVIDELTQALRHPRLGDLMFYRDPELTDEEVVREALSYRPIEL